MRAPAILAAVLLLTGAARAEDLRFGLPIACKIGADCWVQQYVDHDPSTGVKDYACGAQTYDGHDGTDIRIRDTAATAFVTAAANGVVKAVRDGVPDRLMRTEQDRAAVGNRECGNGVLIDHGNGWETQYCHLRNGSISVKTGDRVESGQRMGGVGYSGMAAFPHVHLSIRKDGAAVDPFRAGADAVSCGAPENPLWTEGALRELAYSKGDIIGFGFAPGVVELEQLESGRLKPDAPAPEWPGLVAYLWAINLLANDEVVITIRGPKGFSAANSVTLDRHKAQYMLFAGKKRPSNGWPKGEYIARLEIRNAGVPRLSREFGARID